MHSKERGRTLVGGSPLYSYALIWGKKTEKFRVIRLALLAVMNLLRKRYGMIAVFIITLALPNHNYAKHI